MTNWPWPLDGVQYWFEELWNNVLSAPFNAANYILNQLYYSFEGVKNFISYNLSYIVNSVTSTINSITYSISSSFSYFYQNISRNFSYLSNLFQSQLNYAVSNIFKSINSISNIISSQFTYLYKILSQNFANMSRDLNSRINWMSGEMSRQFNKLSNDVRIFFDGAMRSAATLLPDVFRNLFSNLIPTIISHFNNIVTRSIAPLLGAIRRLFFGHSPISPEEAMKFVSKFLEDYDHYFGALAAALIVAETISLGQVDFSLNTVLNHPLVAGARSITTSMHTIWFDILYRPLMQRYFYAREVPLIPGIDDLVKMYMRGIISKDIFEKYGKECGYSSEWINRFLEVSYFIPSLSDLKTMWLRGVISEEEFNRAVKSIGMHPDYVEKYKKIIPVIPSISDLINFVVKEVISPEDFIKYAAQQGLSEYWAKNYWEAHWRLPSFENLREAYWRGIITEEEFRKYIVWHDYRNVPRPGISKSDQDIIAELSYELPGRIDLRWMFEHGVISEEDFRKYLRMTGLHPDWVDKVAEAQMRTVMRSEIESVIREAMTDYKEGWLTREEFLKYLKELGLSEKLADYWIARADMIALREEREEKKKILVEAYRLGVLSQDEFRSQLETLGLRSDVIDRIIMLENIRKAGKLVR